MFKFGIILFSISLSFAKLTNNQFDLLDQYDTSRILSKIDYKLNDFLWVLNFNETLDVQRLYLANDDDEKVFAKVIVPAIESYERQRTFRVKKDDPLKNYDGVQKSTSKRPKAVSKASSVNKIKKEILTTINKFFMSHLNDPDLYFHEVLPKNENKSLKLYFIGPYTSLIMIAGRTRNHYFLDPPSKLPNWFYEEHVANDKTNFVEIPSDVQEDFLEKFLDVLLTGLGYPL